MKNNAGTDLSLWGEQGKPDKAIFDEFYDRFFSYMLYHAIKLVQRREEAEDIVAESFIKLWERRRNFENHAAVHGFLQITIRNACLNYLRSSARKQTQQLELSERLSSAGTYDPESIRIEAEVLNEIYKEIDNLPDKCREIFIRSYFGDQDNAGIANDLQITESTVRNQKARAIRLLKSRLTVDGFLILWISVISADSQFVNFYSN